MDLSPLINVVAGGLIVLVGQEVAGRSARRVAQAPIDYERWDAWRREAAEIWAGAVSTGRRLDIPFEQLAGLGEDDLAELRCGAHEVMRSLDRLSVLALDRRVSDWASQLAVEFGALLAATPLHSGCDDEDAAKQYAELRHLFHERFE